MANHRGFQLRHVAYWGPKRPPAVVEFRAGLNVICGASNTGKSFLAATIDYMFGGSKPLKDIPERVGYDRVFLGVETGEGAAFTLERSTAGGDFLWHAGLVRKPTKGGRKLAARAGGKKATLSTFLLDKIGLNDRVVQKNADGDTVSFTFRLLTPFVIIHEADITKPDSLIETGQLIFKTRDFAVFRMLVTGVDDAALVKATEAAAAREAAALRIDVIDEIAAELRQQLRTDQPPLSQVESDLQRLEAALSRERARLDETEGALNEQEDARRDAWRQRDNASGRLSEIAELLSRFELLHQHYESDLKRLEAIAEAGTLLLHLPVLACPLCGSLPEHHGESGDACDGDITAVADAAKAEMESIYALRANLEPTVADLEAERSELLSVENAATSRITVIQQRIDSFLAVDVAGQRSMYSDLVERQADLRHAVVVLRRIDELEQKRTELSATPSDEDAGPLVTAALPASVAENFSQEMEEVLRAWHFPGGGRVHFDNGTRDFVVGGQPRSSYGKGLRAVTHAAFTVTLLRYCTANSLPHPGFLVLDSPLLAYREPEGIEPTILGSGLGESFYAALAADTSAQLIIVENEHPSAEVNALVTVFTNNPVLGRQGLFPRAEKEEDPDVPGTVAA
jgi:hypothetical protein